MSSHDPERLHEHEKPRAPEHKPEPAEDPAAPLKELVSGVGNRAFSSAVARAPGAGILANGEVHPEVQSSINSTRGSGSSLDSGVAERLSPSLGDLSDVRVHTDDTADDAQPRRVRARVRDRHATSTSPRASTSRTRRDGDKLIAHELAHVVQQRGAPTSGPLTVSQPGDAMEREADVGRRQDRVSDARRRSRSASSTAA